MPIPPTLFLDVAMFRFLIEYVKLQNPNIKIIASASTPAKVELMKKAGVDVPFNYRAENTDEVLKKHGPIDMYVPTFLGTFYGRSVSYSRNTQLF